MRVRPLLVAASLLLPALALPGRAATAPTAFDFARVVVGSVAAPAERTYAVPPGALLAGVTWTSGDADVWVRRGAGAWEQLENDAEQAGERPGTEPYWLGRGLAPLVVRVVPRRTVTGLSVDFVGSGPTQQPPPKPQTRALPRLGAVVTRAGWGADERLRSGTPKYTTPRAVVVHHTVTSNDYTPAEAASYVRAVYGYHTRSRGWSDIGYNLIVDRFGTVYEGRYGGFDRGVVGAHTAGFNDGTLGVSLLGNYDVVQPPAAVVEAVARAGAWAAERWSFDPRTSVTLRSAGSPRFRAGTYVTVPRMPGHRDLGTTACPGRYAYADLPSIRTEAWHKLAAVFSATKVDGAPVHAPKPVTITATLDHAAYWAATITSQGQQLVLARGAGRSVSVSWDGRIGGLPALPGTYDYALYADDHVHGPSDPVTGTFEVGLPSIAP
jgi:hypothetical protein